MGIENQERYVADWGAHEGFHRAVHRYMENPPAYPTGDTMPLAPDGRVDTTRWQHDFRIAIGDHYSATIYLPHDPGRGNLSQEEKRQNHEAAAKQVWDIISPQSDLT